MKIILAEDNEINATLIECILRDLNMQLDVVPDGLALLEALPKVPYDVILMDLSMPRMDGFEAAKKIRAGEVDARYRTAPIIAISAHATEKDQNHARAAGMNHFVAKPVDPKTLRDLLEGYRHHEPAAE